MSNAVLPRKEVVDRRVLDRGDLRSRRPSSGSLVYRTNHIGVSRAVHDSGDIQVSWRAALATAVVTVGVLCGLVTLAQVATSRGADGPTATEVIQVRAGESLSALAARISPDLPVAQVVDRILELNAMPNSAVYPGQSLIVPSSVGH